MSLPKGYEGFFVEVRTRMGVHESYVGGQDEPFKPSSLQSRTSRTIRLLPRPGVVLDRAWLEIRTCVRLGKDPVEAAIMEAAEHHAAGLRAKEVLAAFENSPRGDGLIVLVIHRSILRGIAKVHDFVFDAWFRMGGKWHSIDDCDP